MNFGSGIFFPVLSKSKSKYGFVSNINEGHHTNSQTQKNIQDNNKS